MPKKVKKIEVLTTSGRDHYLALDGLRGVAALAVVLYHQSEQMLDGKYLQHAPLAVDFFFILSGFVISYAYTERLARGLTVSRFFIERAIRLLPLLFTAAFLGLLWFIWQARSQGQSLEVIDYAVQFVLAAFALPTPPAFAPEPFLLNVPAWSLFFEIIASVVFVLGMYRLSARKLAVATVFFILSRYIAASYSSDSLWSEFSIGAFINGTVGVLSTFALGMVLQRVGVAGRFPRLSVPLPAMAFVLMALLAVPELGAWDAFYNFLCIYILFPLILIGACQRQLIGGWAQIATFSGTISYALYILHHALTAFFHMILSDAKLGALPASIKVFAVTTLIVIVAWLADRLDQRVRSALKRKLVLKGSQRPSQAGSV